MKQIYCTEGTICFKYPLSKKKIIKKVLIFWLILLFYTVVLGLFLIMFLINHLLTLSIIFSLYPVFLWFCFFVYAIIKTIYEIFYFRFYFYDMTDKELIIKKGVITRREILIPWSKIQDIYIDQDFLDRIFGLYDIHVATAATISYYGAERAHIDGVNFKNSLALKEIILEKIKTNRET